jgi:hypothetical protein
MVPVYSHGIIDPYLLYIIKRDIVELRYNFIKLSTTAMKNLVLVLAVLITVANAFIIGLTAPTAPFTVTAHSKMSVVFSTSNSPTTA